MVEELGEGDLVVESRVVFWWRDPSFFDNSLKEDVARALDSLDEVLAGELSRPQQFGFGDDGVSGVGLNVGVVHCEPNNKSVKEVPPLASVVTVVIQKA